MKKIHSLYVVALLGILILVSCNNDDTTNEIATHGLQVLSAQTSFPAKGGTQSIAVAQTPVKAYVNDSWATVTVNGTNINVTASLNPERQSRHATVVVKSTEQDSAVVNIDQEGMIVALNETNLTVGDDATVTSFYMPHNLDVTVNTSADWIKASVSKDSLSLNTAANNTGEPRTGWVYYSSGNVIDSISVLQFEPEKDVLGNYELVFYNNGWQYYNVELYKNTNSSYAMRFTDAGVSDIGIVVPITLDTDYPGFSIQNLDSLGSYTYNNIDYTIIMLVMVSRDESVYYYRSASVIAHAIWTLDEDGEAFYPLESEGTSSGYEFYSLRIGLSTDGTYNGFINQGRITLMNLPYAQFQKVTSNNNNSSNAKSLNSSKGPKSVTKMPARLKWKAPELLPDTPLEANF